MSWEVEFLEEARKDLHRLDGSQRLSVLKAIRKVQQNPIAQGYGKPLGNRGGSALSGLMKIKLRKSGIRIVYQLVTAGGVMRIVIIGMRSDTHGPSARWTSPASGHIAMGYSYERA